MPLVFKDMELDDEDMLDQGICVPCATETPKKMLPQFPWGLRISLTNHELEKLGIKSTDLDIDGVLHLHALAAVTSISCDKRQDGTESHRVELQIQKLAIESEDEENQEAETAMPVRSGRRAKVLYGKG